MPANTRQQPPRRQPLRSHFRTQKAGHTLVGNEKSANIKPSIKDNKGKGKAEDVSIASNDNMEDVDPSTLPTRISTPPPKDRNENQVEADGSSSITFVTPRTPPRTPKPRSRTATLPDLDLLEPLQRSPVSVRTDPDTGKLFLLLPSSDKKNNNSTSKSTIASTPPARRLFSNELASAQAKELNTPSKLLYSNELDQDDQPRPAKRLKKSSVVLDAEEIEGNPFVSSQTSLSNHRLQPTFIQPSSSSTLQGSKSLPLPDHHATLYALHKALEHALVVHLAASGTAGSIIEETRDGSNSILAIPQLISFTALRPLVERSSGRRFGKNELARLLWLWGATENSSSKPNIGFTITKSKVIDKTGKRHWELMLGIRLSNNEDGQWNDEEGEEGESDVDFDDQDELKIATQSASKIQQPIKLPMTPRSQTRALGISAPQSPSPSPRFTRTPMGMNGKPITPPISPLQSGRSSRHVRFNSGDLGATDFAPSSPSSAYAQRGKSIVALWNVGMEQRKRIVRKRLLKWCLACLSEWRQSHGEAKKEEKETENVSIKHEQEQLQGLGIQSDGQEPASSSTRGSKVFAADNYVFKWDSDFPLERVAPIPMAPLPSIELEQQTSSFSSPSTSTAPVRKSKLEMVRDAHQTAIAQSEEKLGRKLTLAERIKAKEQAAAAGMKRGREDNDVAIQQSTSASSIAALARQKSALSRLQDVAESIYMLFVSSGGQGGRNVIGKYSPLPLQDVIKAVCNASKQVMGNFEARQALQQLQTIAPGFIEIEKIGMRDWVKLIGNVKGAEEQDGPSSGGNGVLTAVRRLVKLEMERVDT